MNPASPTAHVTKVILFLRAAQAVLAAGLPERATSDAYYATYHAAMALLATAAVAPETHSGMRQMLALHFVRNGPLPPETSQDLNHLMGDRLLADYGVSQEITAAGARRAIRIATRLLRSMLPLVSEREPEAAQAVAEAQGEVSRLDALVGEGTPS
ncbi:MAG TPA: HEPN domain-containing protein [Acetobacteraceae bacterium]|nr:HEPN domain-containing protein [Acetobacteraceae bacterium]